nr:unnamed protein product [Naegleria fowleri]
MFSSTSSVCQEYEFQVLSEKDFKVMAWKNGLGCTKQFCIHPGHCESVNDDFTWRLSSAEMTGGGPFSIFDGYSRVLILLDCKDRKDLDDHHQATELQAETTLSNRYQFFLQHYESEDKITRMELKLMEPYVFSGSLKTDFEIAQLQTDSNIKLQITDFNIMTKNSRARCDLVKCINTCCNNVSLMAMIELDHNSLIERLTSSEERQWNLFVYNISKSSIHMNDLTQQSTCHSKRNATEEIAPSCLLWINFKSCSFHTLTHMLQPLRLSQKQDSLQCIIALISVIDQPIITQ